MGQRASETSDVLFEDVRVPEASRARGRGEGFKIAMRTIDVARAGVAAMAVGLARAAYEHAAEYGRQRVQFGQPIAMNQAIYFLLADMATDIEAAAADVEGGVARGPGKAEHEGVVLRQGVRGRPRDARRHRCGADLRRVRLHEGLPR